ncbi:hypothetical protein [Pantoea sp. ACRSB]|uniref:hypothetical protein n=1 Tax=Pantoea sp. ACRSB TaxID=2918207 RepID=UPI002892EFFC|nr:hypothetical protein [Pantoea sp. ACRSB]MCG7387309.1 hypothetical protein [Pantoea sp. ACRSB]
MTQVVIKGLSQYGVITDVPPFETPANAWTEVRNCSFENGGLSKSGTRESVMIPSTDQVNKIYPKNGNIFYSTHDKIYRATGVANIDVSRNTDAYLTADEWFCTELSNVIIFTNDSNVPQMFKPTSNRFEDLTAWGVENGSTVNWRTSKLRAFKNFLIAIGMLEDGVDYTQRIRWSDIALPNEAPPSWDATSTTGSAGFNDLSEARGKLIDGLPMGEYFILYTSQEVFLVTYVGGNDIFTFRKIFDNLSILAPECVAQVKGGHFLVTTSDIVIHNGSTWESIIENKIKRDLFETMSAGETANVKVQAYPAKQEVWVLYPSSKGAALDRAAIYSLNSNTWTYRELPNVTTISYGILPTDNDRLIDLQAMLMDDDPTTFNGVGQDFVRGSLFVNTKELDWWAVDEGSSGSVNLPSIAIKQNIDFDDYGLEATSHKMVKGIYPQISGTGTVFISVGVAENPYDAPAWSESVEFEVGVDRKADFRVSGRYISIRFEAFSKEYWTLTSYGIDVTPRGKR